MRRLLAYAREFVRPRPYPLRDLAEAGGMSASSVRTAFTTEDVDQIAHILGRRPAGGFDNAGE
jgi:hypothetical protein